MGGIRRVGVVGSGLMGSGIAEVCARADLDVLVGEVSQVNDDRTDNYFLEPIGRFAKIEEDEPRTSR